MLYGLAQVGSFDMVRVRQIGNCSGYPQYPMARAGREVQAFDGGAQ
jgi:hypothetical protein